MTFKDFIISECIKVLCQDLILLKVSFYLRTCVHTCLLTYVFILSPLVICTGGKNKLLSINRRRVTRDKGHQRTRVHLPVLLRRVVKKSMTTENSWNKSKINQRVMWKHSLKERTSQRIDTNRPRHYGTSWRFYQDPMSVDETTNRPDALILTFLKGPLIKQPWLSYNLGPESLIDSK